MLQKWKKLEFLALTVASIFTTTPIYAAHISLPVQTGEYGRGRVYEIVGFRQLLSANPPLRKSIRSNSELNRNDLTNILVQNVSAEEVFQQGLNFSAQKNMVAAEAAFRRVIQINPNFAEAYANLGSILANQNKLAEALPNFDNAIRIKPDVPEFHYMKGQVLYAQNKMSDAVESVKIARDLFRKQGKTQEANTLEQILKDMGSR